jgi:hypothetical protein
MKSANQFNEEDISGDATVGHDDVQIIINQQELIN